MAPGDDPILSPGEPRPPPGSRCETLLWALYDEFAASARRHLVYAGKLDAEGGRPEDAARIKVYGEALRAVAYEVDRTLRLLRSSQR